jgi:hypothetical protein
MRISLGARHDFLRRYGVADHRRAQTLGDLARVLGGGTPSRDESRFWIGGKILWATPRPKVPLEIRQLIREMSLANPL